MLIAAGIWALTKLRASSSLKFFPKAINFDGSNLLLTLAVQNSSMFPVSFQSFDGDVFANGTPLGHVSDFQPQTIIGLGETDLNLSLMPSFSGIVQSIKNLLSTGSQTAIELKGTLKAENLTVPVDAVFNPLS